MKKSKVGELAELELSRDVLCTKVKLETEVDVVPEDVLKDSNRMELELEPVTG